MCCGLLLTRQTNGEFGELADPTIDLDGPAVLLGHDVVADRKPKSGPLSCGLGGEERLKEFILDLGRNADPVIACPDFYCIAEISRRYL